MSGQHHSFLLLLSFRVLGSFYWLPHERVEDTQCHLCFTCFVSGFYFDKICQNDLLLLDSNILNIFQITLHPGGAEDENFDVVECFGFIGDACHMDVMVGAIYIYHSFAQ